MTDQVPTLDSGVPRAADANRLHRRQIAALGVCALGFTFDLGEIVFGTVLSAVFAAPPHSMPAGELSWLLASVYVGAIVGAPLFGAVADRRGCRWTLSLTMLLLAATSVAGCFSWDLMSLTASRFLSGLALGAYPPLMIAYLTELLPPRRRGGCILAVVAIGYLGPPATIFLIRMLTPLSPLGWEAWRWALAACGFGAGVTGLLFPLLPSLRLQLASAENGSASPRPVPRLFALVALLSFLSPWATVAFPLLSGVLLVEKGFKLSDTLLFVGVSTFGPFVGTALAAFGADRIQRRTALMLCGGGMAALSAVFWSSTLPLALMLSSFGFSLLVALYVPALSIYVAELFPTAVRARATASAWAVNRVAAALGPLILLPLMNAQGPAALFLVVLGAMIGSVALIAFAAPRGSGQATG